MINYKIKTDKYGNELVNYVVLKGDTFVMSLSLSSNGEIVSRETIEKVVYKQADEDYVEVYSNEFEYDEELQRYIMEIPSNVTSEFSEDITYVYEIEVTMAGGNVITPTQAKIQFTSEIVK